MRDVNHMDPTGMVPRSRRGMVTTGEPAQGPEQGKGQGMGQNMGKGRRCCRHGHRHGSMNSNCPMRGEQAGWGMGHGRNRAMMQGGQAQTADAAGAAPNAAPGSGPVTCTGSDGTENNS